MAAVRCAFSQLRNTNFIAIVASPNCRIARAHPRRRSRILLLLLNFAPKRSGDPSPIAQDPALLAGIVFLHDVCARLIGNRLVPVASRSCGRLEGAPWDSCTYEGQGVDLRLSGRGPDSIVKRPSLAPQYALFIISPSSFLSSALHFDPTILSFPGQHPPFFVASSPSVSEADLAIRKNAPIFIFLNV